MTKSKAEIAEYMRAYRQANRERVAKHSRDYYQRNREKIVESKRDYYRRNRQKKLAYQQNYYKEKSGMADVYEVERELGIRHIAAHTHCLTCRQPLPQKRNYERYCSRSCYMAAFAEYRPGARERRAEESPCSGSITSSISR